MILRHGGTFPPLSIFAFTCETSVLNIPSYRFTVEVTNRKETCLIKYRSLSKFTSPDFSLFATSAKE